MSKKEAGAKSKRDQLRAERQRRSMLWNILILGTIGAFILIIIVYFIASQRPGALAGELVVNDEGRGHVPEGTPLMFQHDPPSSGTHYEKAADWGLAATPIVPGIYLHNLGIGGVVVLYECAAPCPELEQQFKDLYKKVPPDSATNTSKMLITRYDKPLPAPLVVLAWGHQLNLPTFDLNTLLTWYKRFVNQGPEQAR